jgi:hypothetical protein
MRQRRKEGKSGPNRYDNQIAQSFDIASQAGDQHVHRYSERNLLADIQRHVLATSTAAASVLDGHEQFSSRDFRKQLKFQHDYDERLRREELRLQGEPVAASEAKANSGLRLFDTCNDDFLSNGNGPLGGNDGMEIEDDGL